MSKALVIGAGIAGIASAIRLAAKGYEVEVYEANAYPGGKIAEVKLKGYRFDAGPSLLTMPQYIDELFELAGKDSRNYIKYEKLDLICRYFYEDGTRIDAWADDAKFVEELAAKTVDSKESVSRFLKKSAAIYDITHHVFLEKSLHKLSTYTNLQTARSILRFPQIDSFRTLNQANRQFFKDSKTTRIFNRYATYNGSDPYRSPATLNVIPHLERGFGAFIPEKGMYDITDALVTLARELGVKFNFNKKVEKIIHENGRVKGLLIEKDFVPADLVVSNSDIWFVYKNLLKDEPMPKNVQNQERSSSALIFYWCIEKDFPELDLHNIFFSENYEEEFNYIWKRKDIYFDPTVYVNISCKINMTDAPIGCENWFVLVNAPGNEGQDWQKLIVQARENIIKKLSRILGKDISEFISAEQILDPTTIQSKTGSYRGSLYGASSNSLTAAFLRHPNFSSTIKNLYFVGGSVHPGGGIPLALLSAKIAPDLVPDK